MKVEPQKIFINIELLNGTADGAIKCSNKVYDWIIYKVKRYDINNYSNEIALKQCGIYLLFGKFNNKHVVYIGQANTRKNGNGVLGRVIEHNKAKEKYWTDAFMIISSKNSIGATELNYLENQFCNRALSANVYKIVNSVDPNTGNYSDEVEINMNSFIEGTANVLKILGYDLFGTSKTVEPKKNNTYEECEKLYLKRNGGIGRNIDAICIIENKKYILLSGSKIATRPTNSCPKSVINQRKENAYKIDKEGIVLENIPFNSPSGISQFVMLAASNGKFDLKDENGKTLKEILEK